MYVGEASSAQFIKTFKAGIFSCDANHTVTLTPPTVTTTTKKSGAIVKSLAKMSCLVFALILVL